MKSPWLSILALYQWVTNANSAMSLTALAMNKAQPLSHRLRYEVTYILDAVRDQSVTRATEHELC